MESFAGRRSKYEIMEEMAGEVSGLLEDLYISGFDTVHDSTLEEMQKAAKLTAQYGMAYLSDLLSELADEISAGRHQMEKKTARPAQLYAGIVEYLYLCRQKAAYDRGWDYYS